MTSEKQSRLEALPIFLQPRFRLFLSADLVGSTAAKQRPNFPIEEPGKLWADGMAPPWLSPIANFFGSFREAFVREWKIFRTQVATQLGISVRTDPSFWKANGDELIFVKELDDRKEILGCVNAWLQAIKSVRPQLQASNLDVKATAWTAGFPVTNAELVFQMNPGSQPAPYPDDSRLQQFALLEKWHEDSADSKHSLSMDFIGPSVDIGFRLASQSTHRRFVISIDIAYLLATAHLPPRDVIKVPPILYGGRTELKGVLNGKPYPIFWIDTMSNEGGPNPENRLIGVTQLKDVKDFCLEFYQENNASMFLPFIFREHESQYGEFPGNYIEALESLRATWEAEKERYATETAIESFDDNDIDLLNDDEASKKEKDIISAIEKQSPQK